MDNEAENKHFNKNWHLSLEPTALPAQPLKARWAKLDRRIVRLYIYIPDEKRVSRQS
ncbi:MAG: hypothetical protein HYX80_09700 [Chloroflexi bacterium]|nr:hypothetical protein [Chloroflexota bacterium]